jgi:hypothetical protein
MLFQAVMKFLSRLVEFKILVNWGLVHWRAGKLARVFRLQLARSNLANEITIYKIDRIPNFSVQ